MVMQRLHQVLLVLLASTVGIQAVYERYSLLLDNSVSRSAGFVDIYVSRVDQKAVIGVQLAWGVGGKMITATVGSQTLTFPMSGNRALLEFTNSILGVTALTGLTVSVVLNDPANTTLQGTVGSAQSVASVAGPYYAPTVGQGVAGTAFVSAYVYWRNQKYWLAYAVDSRGVALQSHNLVLTPLASRQPGTLNAASPQTLATRPSGSSLTYSNSASLNLYTLAAIFQGTARVQLVSTGTGTSQVYWGFLNGKDYWTVYSSGQVVGSTPNAGAVGIGRFSLSENNDQYGLSYDVTTGGAFPSNVGKAISFYGPANATQTAQQLQPSISARVGATSTGVWNPVSQSSLALFSAGWVYSTVGSGGTTRLRAQVPAIRLTLAGYTHVAYVYDSSDASSGSAVVFLRTTNRDWRSYSVHLQGIDYRQVTAIEFTTRVGATTSVISSSTSLTGRFNNSAYLFTTTNDMVTVKTTANPSGISGNIYASYVAAVPTAPPPTQAPVVTTKAPTTPPPVFGNSYCAIMGGNGLSPKVKNGLAAAVIAELKTIAFGTLGQETSLYFSGEVMGVSSNKLSVSLYSGGAQITSVQATNVVVKGGWISGVFWALSKDVLTKLSMGQGEMRIATTNNIGLVQGFLQTFASTDMCSQMFGALISGVGANVTTTGDACILTALVDVTRSSVTYTIFCNGVPDQTPVTIHPSGRPDVNVDTTRWTSGTPLKGSWNGLSPEELDMLVTYQVSVTVGSPVYLRGTIVPIQRTFSGILAGVNQVPTAVQGTTAGGFVLGTLSGNQFSYEVFLSGVQSNIIAAHFHGPAAADKSAGVAFDLKNALITTDGRDTIALSTVEIVNLYNGLYYLNIHSDRYNEGELRAQVRRDTVSVTATDGDPILFVAALSNGRLTSPNPAGVAGMARLRLHVGNSLEYIVQFSDVQPYGTAVTGLAVYAYKDDNSWGKAFDLDLSQVSNNEARGRLTLSEHNIDLLLRNRLFVRLTTGLAPNGALQGQILYRRKSYAIALIGAALSPPVASKSGGFGVAELDPTGNLHFSIFFTQFSSTVIEIGLYDKTNSLRFDMTNRLQQSAMRATWPNVRGNDLFNLASNNFYVLVKTLDNPSGELKRWLQPVTPSNIHYQFSAVVSDSQGGVGLEQFRLTQDNKIDYLFFFDSFSSASTIELDYFGVKTVQVPTTVSVPNPSAGPNSTVSPTITTNTVVSVNQSTWLSVAPSPIQVQWLSPTAGLAQGTIDNPTTGAQWALIRNRLRIQVKNSGGSVVSSTYTFSLPLSQRCVLSGAGVTPPKTSGAIGAATLSFDNDGSFLYEIFANGLDGDGSLIGEFVDSTGSTVFSTSDFIEDTIAEGVVKNVTLDQYLKIVSGQSTVRVTLGTDSIACTPSLQFVPFDVFTTPIRLASLLTIGGAKVVKSSPTTGGVGLARAEVSDDGIVQIYVHATSLSSAITGIYLTYYNNTSWVSLLGSGLLASQFGSGSLAYVSWKPSNPDVFDLLVSQNIYVVVATENFAKGEVAGPLAVNSAKFRAVLASFNASSPSAGSGVAVVASLDDYGLFHLTGYFSNVRYVPARAMLTVKKPGWTKSQILADVTSGIVDTDQVIAQTAATPELIYYLGQGWVRMEVYTDIPHDTLGPDLLGVLTELPRKPTNVRQKLDFGSVLTGGSLASPGAAGCLFRLDDNWTLTFELFAVGTDPLLNVTVLDGDDSIVAVADIVFAGELRAVGSAVLDKNQAQSLRNGDFSVRALTRGYPRDEGEVSGSIAFLRKVYYGLALLETTNGVGAYHKTVLDTSGTLHFNLQLSGLTGPIAWVALQQNDRNVSIITHFFQANRARGLISDLSVEQLMLFDLEHESSYAVGVTGSPGSSLSVDVVEAEDRDVYPAHYTASMTGQQVARADGSRPAVATMASGISIAFFDKSNNLDYRVFILSDDPLTSVGFYGPAGQGYDGPLLYNIPVGKSPLLHGKWSNPSAAVKWALASGQVYILAKSKGFPNGLLRGQLRLEPHYLYTVLSSSQELHSVTPSGSAGYGEFLLSSSGYLHYKVVVEGISQVVPAHIHGTAEFFETAHHVHTIELNQQTDGSLMATGRWGPLGADEVGGLINGNYYVNIHTSANPAGELRGHITVLQDEDYNVLLQFEALLSGASAHVVSVAAGHAFLWLTDDDTLYFEVTIIGTDVTGLYIRGPGSQSFDLSPWLNGPKASGSLPFTNANDRFSLINGDLYMLVTSQGNPSGELRGQIRYKPQTNMAILNRADVGRTTPFAQPVASSGLGIFVFEKDAKFNYRVNYTGLSTARAATVKQPNWGDRTLTSPNPRYGRSQLVSNIESRNIAFQRTTLEVSAFVPTVATVLSGTFRYNPIPEPIKSLLFGQPFVDGALAVMLDPNFVEPLSMSYLSAGGVLYLSFDEASNSLFYVVDMAGITGPITKAEFHDRTTQVTLFDILPVVGSDSYNGYKFAVSSIIINPTQRAQFSNGGVCLQIESSTSASDQTSVVRGCIDNTLVFPPCYDSGRVAWIAENQANTLVTLVNDSFLFPSPQELNYTLLQGKWSWWSNSSLFQDVPVGTGRLLTAAALDYEKQHQHNLTIGMIRKGNNYCNMTLLVNVRDLNDNDPYFWPDGPRVNGSTKENSSVTVPVWDIYVGDADSPDNGNPEVKIIDQLDSNGKKVFNFYIYNEVRDSPAQNSIAHVMAYQPLDYELPDGAGHKYTLLLEAYDAGKPKRTSRQYLDLWVMDVNDNPPVFNLNDPGYASTSVDETHKRFFPFQNYSATDADSGVNAMITYRILGGDPTGTFDVQPEVGGFHLALLQSLNHESIRNYLLTIQAIDGGRPAFTSRATVNITVLDIPFRVELAIPCGFVYNREDGWFSTGRAVSLTFFSNEEDGVRTVPQFECRFLSRAAPTAAPNSPSRVASLPASCGRGNFPTSSPYGQPDQPSLDDLNTRPFQNCGPSNILTRTESMNHTKDGTYEFQVRTRLRNPAKDVTTYWYNAITYTIDTVPPKTTIDRALLPSDMRLRSRNSQYVTNNQNPAFVYYSSEAKSVYDCSLWYCSIANYASSGCDGGWMPLNGWVSCNKVYGADTSRTTVQPTDIWNGQLLEGWYRLGVCAIDPAGNRDPKCDAFIWEMDTSKPIVGFQTLPDRINNATQTNVVGLKNDVYANYVCRVNNSIRACSSSDSHGLAGLPFGKTTFSISATDEALNVADQIDYSFHVETSAPPISLTRPDQYAFRNRSDAVVYFQTAGVYQDLACHNMLRNIPTLLTNCCREAFGQDKVAGDCLSACNDLSIRDDNRAVSYWPRNDVCRPFEFNYTTCLERELANLPPIRPRERYLFHLECGGGAFDMGRSMSRIDVYTLEIYAQDQAGNAPVRLQKNYVYDPRFVSQEQAIAEPIQSDDCPSLPISLIYIILVAVSWGLVLITIIIFIIAYKRQRAGPAKPGSGTGRRSAGQATRMTALAARAEAKVDISQFETAAYDDVAPEPLASSSDKALIGQHMEAADVTAAGDTGE